MNSDKKTWYLRKPDGSEYGPITTSDLQRWATQCRIVAGNGVSSDREEWVKVEDIPELEMDWIAHRLDGSEYGPFNIAATQELIDHNVLTDEATLTHKTTKKSVTVKQVLNEEDLFVEPDQQDQDQNDNEELTLSEEALKEEAFYAEVETTEPPVPNKEDKEDTTIPPAEEASEEVAETHKEPAEETSALQDQVDELTEKLQKAKTDLTQSRKDLKSVKQEMAETIETLAAERDQANNALTAQQNALEKLKQKHVKDSEANAIQLEELEAKLEESRQTESQAEAKLSRLSNEISEAERKSLQSVAELRKQTAFMKKNSATLQHELEKSRTIANRRGHQLIIIITVIGIIAGIMLLTGKPGCRKTDKNVIEEPVPQSIPETTEDLDISQLPYSDIQDSVNTSKKTDDQRAHSPIVPPHGSPIAKPFPKIMIEGVKATSSGNTCSIRFDSGVFTTLTIPSANAKLQLTKIAEALRPQISDMKIVVEGCTDNIPMRKTATYDGNHALGLARAETVKKLLITKGNIPSSAISTRYAGEKNGPYPNDTAENRKRNRTVVLKLVRSVP